MTGEHLAPDVQELIRLFDSHGVRYLLVGGERQAGRHKDLDDVEHLVAIHGARALRRRTRRRSE